MKKYALNHAYFPELSDLSSMSAMLAVTPYALVTSTISSGVYAGNVSSGTLLHVYRNGIYSGYNASKTSHYQVQGTLKLGDFTNTSKAGGNAWDAQIVSGGIMLLQRNATASSTTVSSGGSVSIIENGRFYTAQVFSGGVVNIFTESDFSAPMIPFWHAKDVTLSGGMLVASGTATMKQAKTLNTQISSGGLEQMGKFAYASSSIVYSGGKQLILGKGGASSTEVRSGGILQVKQDGSASTVTQRYGGALILSAWKKDPDNGYTSGSGNGAFASGTHYDSAGGSQTFHLCEGSATDINLYRLGILSVANSGYASNTIVHSGGTLAVKVALEPTATALTGGVQILNVTQHSSGILQVNAGGNDGSYLSGTNAQGSAFSLNNNSARNFILYNSGFLRMSSGYAYDTLIASGGLLEINSAAFASNGIVLSGGRVRATSQSELQGTFQNAGLIEGMGGTFAGVVSGGRIELSNNTLLTGTVTNAQRIDVLEDITFYGNSGGSGLVSSSNIYGNSNNLVMKYLTLSNSIIYGGNDASGSVQGFSVSFENCNLYHVFGGGATDQHQVAGDLSITLLNTTHSGAFYGGGYSSQISGTMTTTIQGNSTFSLGIHGGALQLSNTAAGSIGAVVLNIESGTFAGDVVGGSRIVLTGTATNLHTIGSVTLNLDGGSYQAGRSIYAAGYVIGTSGVSNTTVQLYVANGVDINITNATFSGTYIPGRGIFGGAFTGYGRSKVDSGITMTISGGTLTNVYGGGWAEKNGISEVAAGSAAYAVDISVSGGSLQTLYGGGTHSASGGAALVTGNVRITISGGTQQKIYAGGQTATDTVTGNAQVIFTGSSGNAGLQLVSGTGSSTDNLTGNATLSLNNYTNSNFYGTISAFDTLQVSGSTATTLIAASNLSGVSSWLFDLSDRSATLADQSLLQSEAIQNNFNGDTVTLALSDAQSQLDVDSWNLFSSFQHAGTVLQNLAGANFELDLDGVIYQFAYNSTIASGAFAGWGVALFDTNGDSSNDTLKFAKLA